MQLKEITQLMLEEFEEALSKFGAAAEQKNSVARYNRCILDAATESGMAEGLPSGDALLDLPVWEIRQHTRAINEHVQVAKAPPSPN